MAKIETKNIIASSLDNFIIFENPNYTQMPYVTIGIPTNAVGSDITLVFEDADDSDAAKIEIEGKSSSYITSRTFNTSDSITQLQFSLMECLKMLSIVYDVVPASANSLRMGLDTSRKWKITSNKLTIGGNYSSYNPETINKWVVMVNGNIDSETSQFSLEKYNNNQEISFNISSPFAYITTKFPFRINLSAYCVSGNSVTAQTINNNQLLIMPTTLNKFDKVDYDEFFIDAADSEKKKFLTNSRIKHYNYDEYVGLSILTNRTLSSVTLIKKYYTNSGMYLTSKTGVVLKELNNSRMDFYDTFDLLSVENLYNHQVGYIDVVAVSGSTELTEPMRYYVEPKCDDNDTLFFINTIGGLDSYNFNGEHKFSSGIDEITTYMKNPQKPYEYEYGLEYVKQSAFEQLYTSTSSMIGEEMADWLVELQKSKYIFKFDPADNVHFKMILLDDMTIELSDNEKYYEIECKYRYADTKINV